MPSSLFGPNQNQPLQNNSIGGIQQIKSMMQMIQNSNNPSAMLQTLMMQNPKLQSVMQFINQNGGDPKAAFYALAKQKGVDPNEVINMLK
jgi:hypothetical protein